MIWSRATLAQENLPSEDGPPRSGNWRRLMRVPLTTAVAVGLCLTLAAGNAVATQAAPTTNDQSTTINTAWWTYAGVTATQVGSLLSANSARLTQIRVENPVGPVFDVTMVSNSGAYASGWWWYYGLTAAAGQQHAQHEQRPAHQPGALRGERLVVLCSRRGSQYRRTGPGLVVVLRSIGKQPRQHAVRQ